jgi:hypothetical protein
VRIFKHLAHSGAPIPALKIETLAGTPCRNGRFCAVHFLDWTPKHNSGHVEMEATDKPKRRSHYQALARRKIKYGVWCGGDGEWLRLSRCEKRWKYWLFSDNFSAMWKSAEMCGQEGRQMHSHFRLIG